MSLRNNLISGGGVNAVAGLAKLRVIDNAVLSDSSHNPAHPSVTSSCCVHQFVRSQMNSTVSQMNSTVKLSNTNRQIVVVMIHIFSQDVSYNQD